MKGYPLWRWIWGNICRVVVGGLKNQVQWSPHVLSAVTIMRLRFPHDVSTDTRRGNPFLP